MRLLSFSIFLILIVKLTYGQTGSTNKSYEQSVISPNPNAAALAKYIDYPVSMSTGVPNISIPVYTLNSSQLSVPVSISYHAGGIKVSDMAYTMGAGWTLNAGGAISRTLKDIPDETTYGFYNMVYPDENVSSTYQKEYCFANHIVDINTANYVKYDGEPDIFYYNFGDQSGTFIYKNRKAAGVNPQAITNPFSPVAITWNNLTYFTTKDLKGNTYQFGNTALSTAAVIPGSKPLNVYASITNAWYLTKIISADKTDSVSFIYEQNNPISTAAISTATAEVFYGFPAPGSSGNAQITHGGSPVNNETDVRIKEITGQNGKMDFTYDSNSRLSNIAVYNIINNVASQIKAFKFFQSAFTTTPESAFSNGVTASGFVRPRLDSVQEFSYLINTAISTNPPYKFSYLTTDLPDIFSKSADFWGFYNGKNNLDMLYVNVVNSSIIAAPDKRAVDSSMTKKGILTRIIYPSGGYTDFLTEPNQIYTNRPATTTIPQSVTHHISTMLLVPNNTTSGASLTFTPNTNIIGSAKLDFTGSAICTPSGSCASNVPEVILKDVTTNTVIDDIPLNNLYHNTVTSQESVTYYNLNTSHQYNLYFPTPGTITTSGEPTQYRLDAVLTETMPSQSYPSTDSITYLAGGLRIKQIKHNDGRGSTLIKTYNYKNTYFNSNLFKGDFSYIMTNLTRDKNTFTQNNWEKTRTLYSEGLNIPFGSTANSSVSYQQVEEVQSGTDGSTLGKTVYTYNTALDYISNLYPVFREGKDYIRSQLLDTKTYRNNGSGQFVLIQDVINNYNNINEAEPDNPGSDSIKYYKVLSDLDIAQYISIYGNSQFPNAYQTTNGTPLTTLGCPIYANNLNSQLHIAPFYYHIVRPVMTSTITTTYDLNGLNPITLETDYAYSNLAHMQPTQVKVINSNNKARVQTTRYPLDYNYQASCNLQACVANFNQQLTSLKDSRDQCELSVTNGDSTDPTTHSNALTAYDSCESNYNTSVTGLVNQYNSCLSNFQSCYTNIKASLAPVSKAIAYMQDKNIVTPKIAVITTVNSSQVLKDSTDYNIWDAAQNIIRPKQINIQVMTNPIEARAQFYAYDVKGNLQEQSKTGDTHSAYQWGNNGTYPVAKADNARVNDIFYDSFEEGNGNSTSNDSKTGHYSYNGSSTSYSKLLTGLDAGSYFLSYWQKNTSGLWAFNSSTVTVSGTSYTISLGGQIDDVRFYPSAAQMTTYTYDPLIGMTSSTDAKNQVTFYEYDGFQRLINIKDKDGNIIRHTDYHYQGQ